MSRCIVVDSPDNLKRHGPFVEPAHLRGLSNCWAIRLPEQPIHALASASKVRQFIDHMERALRVRDALGHG